VIRVLFEELRMFESIKAKLWGLLKGKEVSLAMLYNREGEILWHKGRAIIGRTIEEGDGFSKSYIKGTIKNPGTIDEENIVISSEAGNLSRSADILHIKSLIIQPVSDQYFLYIDSGIKEAFSDTDREVFKVIGELLGETINQVKKNQQDIGGITGGSEKINDIRELVLKYSLEENPVLLLGETGTGKSRIAELIHRYSGRKGKFFTVNTPGIPDNLLESEIFGHKKGAFTDARVDKKGFVDEAAGGTLFFDEISEVPITFQAKLLRFIETRKYQVLGEPVEREADVRILAATNRDLKEAIRESQFREDLYFRLQVLEIEIPPLRKRKEDIRNLVLENRELLKTKEIGSGFWEAIYAHDWPGNVRELITVLTRAGIHSAGPITGKDIQDVIHRGYYKKAPAEKDDKMERIRIAVEEGKSFWEAAWQPFIKRYLNRCEIKQFIEEEYVKNNFSLKKMSQQMHIKDSEFKRFIAALHNYDIHPAKKKPSREEKGRM
jgi:transcriptional regulator with PAS, ATPase and Fis domain